MRINWETSKNYPVHIRWSIPTKQSRGVTLKVHAPMLLSLYPYQQALQHFWKHLVQMLRLRSVRLRPAFRLGVTRIKNWPQPLGSLFRVCTGPRKFVELEPFLSDPGSWGMGVSQMLKPTWPYRSLEVPVNWHPLLHHRKLISGLWQPEKGLKATNYTCWGLEVILAQTEVVLVRGGGWDSDSMC